MTLKGDSKRLHPIAASSRSREGGPCIDSQLCPSCPFWYPVEKREVDEREGIRVQVVREDSRQPLNIGVGCRTIA